MQNIKLLKVAGCSYRPHTTKVYEVSRAGEGIGFIAQDITLSSWVVRDPYFLPLAQHSTIKAAVKKAKQVLV